MEGSNEQDKAKKGLEGTAIDLPTNRRVNLKSATSDDDFTNILAHIKSSKTPVSPTTSLQINFFFFLLLCMRSYMIYVFHSYVRSQNCLQAVIKYGAPWYATTSP